MSYFSPIFLCSFRATGDHLPQAPPAPAHALLAAQQAQQEPQYQGNSYDAGDEAQWDNGQYDPRYNDPNFDGNRIVAGYQHVPQPQAPVQPVPQWQQPQQAAPVPSWQQPQQQQQQAYVPQPQYQTTTPAPHRFQPPGKLSLSRTPDGFSYTFNKV